MSQNHSNEFFKMMSEWKSPSHVQLFGTPWTIQSMKFSRPEYWNGQPFPSPGESSQPRDQTQVSHTTGRFFTSWATREALKMMNVHEIKPFLSIRTIWYIHSLNLENNRQFEDNSWKLQKKENIYWNLIPFLL